MGYIKTSERQTKTTSLYKPEHILKSNDLTMTTPQTTKHKQYFKPPRKMTDQNMLQVDDTSTDDDSHSEPPDKPRNPSPLGTVRIKVGSHTIVHQDA
ncbi:hypothetical protein JTB14_018229 [Gonioctena quinquepunctata]|nr:hypothetical protein JTB14_018229 [Gonioctena quinquepunctata]